MKKYPIVIQDEIKYCGVSCILMILKYYGGYVSKKNLIDMTKTSKDGTTAYHIKETLKTIGFETKGIRSSLDDMNNVILPCIANVTIDKSYKHFIVIYEINYKKKYLIIGDPADKIKKISFDYFNEIFNNVLIYCYPIKSIPKEINTSKINFIFHILKSNKSNLTNIFILSIFITLFSIITSFYTEAMINNLNFYSRTYLLIIFITFFAVYILKIISNYFRNKLLSYINQKIDLSITLDIYKSIIKLPYYYYKNRTTGDMISRINDLDNVRDMISKVALSLFVDIPLTLVSLIVLYFLNHILFSIGLTILVLYLIIIILFRRRFNDYIKKIQVEKSETTSFMVESIGGFETVKNMKIEDNIIDKFESKYIKLLKNIFKYQNSYFLQHLFKEIINDIGFITVTLVGCILVIDNKMSIGTLFTFSSLLIYFLDPIKNVIDLDNVVKEAKVSLDRVLDISTYDVKDNGVIDEFKNGDIEINNLDFSFNDRDYILKKLSLKIKKNSNVMVLGKSGSGKSTLFKILTKYYSISKDKIFINGIDLNNYKKNTIDKNIMYISQNDVLFNDTMYNNLIFDGSNTKALLDISGMCYVDEILDSNLGFNMLVEESGFNLSGGERQRVILARGLLQHFEILIIDEGLSQVDTNMERKILKNIFKYFKNKTIIFVSHRTDNLDLFDDLIKIEDGICT